MRPDESLARKTTLRIGGAADLYVEPAGESDLALTLLWCRENHRPFILLGRGSNLVVRDGGVRGVVIHLSQRHFGKIARTGNRLRCGAGARLKNVAAAARVHGIGGMEFMEGIPGTVGGALRMNAGAMAAEMFEVVENIRIMDYSGRVFEASRSEIEYSYRSCPSLHSAIALAAVLIGHPDSPESIAETMLAFSRKRRAGQPPAASAGCMFKNPPAGPAGKILDELGLKGMRLGGVRVSEIHANFLVNDGTGTAAEVLELIETIRRRVREERGIDLQPEVHVIGEDLQERKQRP